MCDSRALCDVEHVTSVEGNLLILKMVGLAGFEPTTPCPPGRCATRLRYSPFRERTAKESGEMRIGKHRKSCDVPRMNRIKTAIVGASGYTGMELLRLLLIHPRVSLVAVLDRKSVV